MEKIKVFLVDDDKDWLEFMSLFLINEPDIVIQGTATTKKEAISRAKSMDMDVILMNLNLSGNKHDGIDVLREISKLKKVKTIMLTSLSDLEVIIESFVAGAVNYINKRNYKWIPDIIRATIHAGSPLEIILADYTRLKENERKNIKNTHWKINKGTRKQIV